MCMQFSSTSDEFVFFLKWIHSGARWTSDCCRSVGQECTYLQNKAGYRSNPKQGTDGRPSEQRGGKVREKKKLLENAFSTVHPPFFFVLHRTYGSLFAFLQRVCFEKKVKLISSCLTHQKIGNQVLVCKYLPIDLFEYRVDIQVHYSTFFQTRLYLDI